MALNIGYLTSDIKQNKLYSPFYIVDHIIKYLSKDKIIRLKEEGFNVVRSSLVE